MDLRLLRMLSALRQENVKGRAFHVGKSAAKGYLQTLGMSNASEFT